MSIFAKRPRSRDSCHECLRIKETTNSAEQNIFITPRRRAADRGKGRYVVRDDTRGGVRFRHESSSNERVCRPYRDVRPQVELNPSKERSNLTGGGFLGLAAARSRARSAVLLPSPHGSRRHPCHLGKSPLRTPLVPFLPPRSRSTVYYRRLVVDTMMTMSHATHGSARTLARSKREQFCVCVRVQICVCVCRIFRR